MREAFTIQTRQELAQHLFRGTGVELGVVKE